MQITDVLNETKKCYSQITVCSGDSGEIRCMFCPQCALSLDERLYKIQMYKVDDKIAENKRKRIKKVVSGIAVEYEPTEVKKPAIVEVPASKLKESDLLPRITDIIEYIRQKPRSMEEICSYFDFEQGYAFKELMKFKLDGKIWYELSSKTWNYGLDRNPLPVTADVSLDIGV